MHAALETARESPLAASARMNLRLHNGLLAEFRSDGFRLLRCAGDPPRLGGYAKFSEKFAGLVLVDVHRVKASAACRGTNRALQGFRFIRRGHAENTGDVKRPFRRKRTGAVRMERSLPELRRMCG